MYAVTWDATDTATVGELYGCVQVASGLPVFFSYVVLEEVVYDMMFAASAPGYVTDQPVNVTKWAGNATTTGDIAIKTSLAKTTHITGFNDLSAAQVNTEVDTGLSDIQLDHLFQLADPTGVVANNSFWAKMSAKGSPAVYTTYDGTTDSQEAIRDRGDAAWVTGSAPADPWATALPGAYSAGQAGKILGDNLNATVSSRAVPGDAMTLTGGERTALAGAIWAVLTSSLSVASSIGKLLVDNINATISSRSSHTAADIWASATRTLTSYGTLVSDIATAVWGATTRTLTAFGFTVNTNANATETAMKAVTDKLDTALELDGAVYRYTTNALEQAPVGGGGGGATVAQIWDEPIAGHLTAGSTGAKLNAAASAGDPWTTALPGAYGSGSAGNILGNRLDAAVTTRATPANVQSELVTYGGLKPTTPGATLDVNATGEAGVDWGNVGNKTTINDLTQTKIQTVGTLTNAPPDSTGVTTLLTRIPAALFSGITSLAQWLGLAMGKQTGNATARTEVRATGGGSGTFDETTDSQEALRDRGDAAWVTGAAPADPWLTLLPGGYGAGSAGNIVGNRVDATVSSRATQTSVDTIGTNVGTINTNVSTLLTRITSTLFTGITSLAQWLGIMLGQAER
jgi:hypothetical protein